jgi:hypothetical protein
MNAQDQPKAIKTAKENFTKPKYHLYSAIKRTIIDNNRTYDK